MIAYRIYVPSGVADDDWYVGYESRLNVMFGSFIKSTVIYTDLVDGDEMFVYEILTNNNVDEELSYMTDVARNYLNVGHVWCTRVLVEYLP